MQLFLRILSGIAKSVDPDQSSLIRVGTVCICHFVRNFGVQNFRTFAIYFYLCQGFYSHVVILTATHVLILPKLS